VARPSPCRADNPVKPWLEHQIEVIRTTERKTTVVLDPDCILNTADLGTYGTVIEACDWYTIRKAYEHEGRRRPVVAPKLIILVHSQDHRESRDLPFDIEQASEVARVRVPVPPEYRRLVLDLLDDLSNQAIHVFQRQPRDPVAALVAALWGVALPDNGDPVRELDALIRLRSDPTVPPSLWVFLNQRFRTELAQALVQQPPDPLPLQLAWDEFLKMGQTSRWAPILSDLGPRIITLFYAGLLSPARREAKDLPTWTSVGSLDARARDRLDELRAVRPEPWPPVDFGGWSRLAEWWGELRGALADAGAEGFDLAEGIWQLWWEIDNAFGPWLQLHFGAIMSRTAHMPLTVDKIAPFLARRLRSGEARRILLVVVDGMGLAQWSIIRRLVGVSVRDAGLSFAMVPTLTPVSRQAIFAGDLPRAFPDTLRTTDAEERGWRAFWDREGFDSRRVGYIRIIGATASDVPWLGDVPVSGIVVQALDGMLHAAHVLGDAQVAAGIRTWADHGFLRTLLESAGREGYEVWLTSDHGNLETLPLGKIYEGLAVESAGVRARWYTDPALREGARAEGVVWDPPGLPPNACYPLFAPGRGGYFTGQVRVTHGGFSLDEVIIPLARVVI
jgi:hypothetical protein